MLPSVEATMIVFPDADGPNSLVRSTVIVRMFPATVICTFFMSLSPWTPLRGPPVNLHAGCLDAVEDSVELVPAVGVGGPYGIEAVELGEVAEAAVGGLGHGPLPAPVTPETLGRLDPEALRRLLAEESRALAGGNGSEKEACGEADGARGRRDEVREVAKGPEVEVPALGLEERGQGRALGHVRRTKRLDALGGSNRASGLVARRQHARLFEQLARGRHPEGQRWQVVLRRHDPVRFSGGEAAAPGEDFGQAVLGIHLAAGKRVE